MEKLQVLIKLKITANVIDSHITSILDHDLLNKGFLEKAKIANACPIYKKEPRKKLENGRPASILTTPSKIYERFIHKKILSIVLSAYTKKCFLLRWIKPCFVNVIQQCKWKN